MPIQFEANLPHQDAATRAVLRIFEGAPYTRTEERFELSESLVSSNVLRITPDAIRENITALAKAQGITAPHITDAMDFCVEMETGTGKTYVYIRTILQLYQQYGLHKFMIVVPSVAIREGVLATLRDTRAHFEQLYGCAAEVVEYASKRLHQVRNFCLSNELSILVITQQAFSHDKNILNDTRRDSGNLLELLQTVRPIIVMDEPQEGMDTDNMRTRFAAFNPLFKLRYSATHRVAHNIVHRLTPYDSYNQGLVKKIAVLSIAEANTESNAAMTFVRVNLNKNKNPTATLRLHVRAKNGTIKEKPLTIRAGDDLAKRTNNPIYAGLVVDDGHGCISKMYDEGSIRFTNGETLKEGARRGGNHQAIFREQIRRAIQNHFQRKAQLVPMGIKPLALFFIDRVANYVATDGLIRQLFVEEYTARYQATYGKPPTNIDAVHGGYFAKSNKGDYTDNAKAMEGENAKAIYDRILKEKAQLLSFNEPLEFIFSHSALGVGWDNPNIFTICTLNESLSMVKKRQEIGRGLRLCVDQDGKRYRDPLQTPTGQEVNLLTVVPNEKYKDFVETYQQELHEDMGETACAPDIRDASKSATTIRRNEARFTSNDFVRLWQKIAVKTGYRVHFEEQRLIDRGIAALSDIHIRAYALQATRHRWEAIDTDSIQDAYQGEATTEIAAPSATLDIAEMLATDTALAERTVCNILHGLPEAQITMLQKNPMQFIAEATPRLRAMVGRELVQLVRYEKTDSMLSMEELFTPEETTLADTTETPGRGLYSHILHDSMVEQDMARALDGNGKVRLFLKLPRSYTIPTPIGNYTPDFALVMEKRTLDNHTNGGTQEGAKPAYFYFVMETKGTRDLASLTTDERLKIQCAIKHFEALGFGHHQATHNTPTTEREKDPATELAPNAAYLAPIDSPKSLDNAAIATVGEPIFNA